MLIQQVQNQRPKPTVDWSTSNCDILVMTYIYSYLGSQGCVGRKRVDWRNSQIVSNLQMGYRCRWHWRSCPPSWVRPLRQAQESNTANNATAQISHPPQNKKIHHMYHQRSIIIIIFKKRINFWLIPVVFNFFILPPILIFSV